MNGTSTIEFYQVRHGEALHNLRPEFISGQSSHVALSPRGVEQAGELGNHLKRIDIRPDLVVSSPARRCRQTAGFALLTMGCEIEPVFDERLLELGQGEWEGRRREEVFTEEALKRAIREQMDFSAPSGESINMVAERELEFMNELTERFEPAEDPKVVLGFGHGLATRILAGKLLGWTVDEMRREITPNTSVTLFAYDGNDWGVEYVGKPPAELECRTIIDT